MTNVDKIWRMVGGRKFLAWVGTTGLLVTGQVSQETWLTVTLVFIGGTAVIDAVAVWRGSKAPPAGTPVEAPIAAKDAELEA